MCLYRKYNNPGVVNKSQFCDVLINNSFTVILIYFAMSRVMWQFFLLKQINTFYFCSNESIVIGF